MPLTNLPVQLTSFVGRRQELAEIQRLMASARLVTLTGAGGCGKTRLALHAAAELNDQHTHRVRWVDLARLSDPVLVLPTVAKTVDAIEQPGTPLMDTKEQLVDFL